MSESGPRHDVAGLIPAYNLAPDVKRLAAILASDEAGGEKPPMRLMFLLNFSTSCAAARPFRESSL